MTSMLHNFEGAGEFDGRRQLAELEMVTTSLPAATLLAQNYVGLPLN
jgi:p-hydroxybenzoate 3-monooxygenase